MQALGTLSAFEDVQALLKSKVGEFLAAEQKLRTLQVNPTISIRSQAAGLLAEHTILEGELGEAQTKIAQFQQGAWSISDAIGLGDIGTRLLLHLNKVTNLERMAGGSIVPSTGLDTYLPYLGAVAAAAVLLVFLRK
jgi:hypothetical protein